MSDNRSEPGVLIDDQSEPGAWADALRFPNAIRQLPDVIVGPVTAPSDDLVAHAAADTSKVDGKS